MAHRYWLTTERLGFGKWNALPNASELAWDLWGDDRVTRLFTKGPQTREEVAQRLDSEIKSLERDGTQYFPVFNKTTGELVGCCGLKVYTRDPLPAAKLAQARAGAGSRDYELGIHVRPQYWRGGYGREAVTAILDAAVERSVPVPVRVIVAGHHPDNHGSEHLLLSVGFVHWTKVWFPPASVWSPHAYLALPPSSQAITGSRRSKL